MSQTNLKLTRGQIMTEGLGRAGRPDLISEARLWLNLFLETQYDNQDHEWLLKYVDKRPLVMGDTLPTDYVRMKTITVTPNRLQMRLVEADEWESIRANAGFDFGVTTTGTSRICYIDQATSLIYFWPTPPTAGPGQLVYNYYYYFFPVLPEIADGAHDTDIPVWGLTNDILIEQIYVRALNWNDDLRYKDEKENVMDLLNKSKMNSRDLRAGSPRFKLGRCHKRHRF
jgi:hypothetical protein